MNWSFISTGKKELERNVSSRFKNESNQRRDQLEVSAFIDTIDNYNFDLDRVVYELLELIIQIVVGGLR